MERNFTPYWEADARNSMDATRTRTAAGTLSYFIRQLRHVWAFALLLFAHETGWTQVYNQTITTTGAGTWTAPFGISSVQVEAWGGGGAGGSVTGNGSAGGGASGGGYVRNNSVPVVGGTSYNYSVGAGGNGIVGSTTANGLPTWFINNTTINAVGGNRGVSVTAANTSGAGGAAPNTGNVGGTAQNRYGGAGAAGLAGSYGGGGGSSPGTTANGNNASTSNGGTAPAGGFAGGAGSTTNNVGLPALGIGAGGGGARRGNNNDRNGGNGGGGQLLLTWNCTQNLPYSSGFNQVTSGNWLSTCWNFPTVVTGSGSNISVVTTGDNPTTSPQEGSQMVRYNSYSASSGHQERLVAPNINTTGTSVVDVQFYWYADRTAFTTSNDGVQVQYSTDNGSTWVSAGSFISRVDPSIPNGTAQWVLKTVTLPTNAGNIANLQVAFLFTSQFGNNCYLDATTIRAAPACTGTPVPGNTIASRSFLCANTSVNFSLSNAFNANGISYAWQSAPDVAGAPGTFTNIGGATSSTLTQTVTATTWYRCQVTCGSNTGISTPVQVVRASPSVVSVANGSVCGPQSASISAVVSSGSVARWYTTASGGNYVGSGSPFTTPEITAATTYWVQAETEGSLRFPKVGTGTGSNGLSSYPSPLSQIYNGNKHQILIRATELTALGFNAGDYITSIGFTVTSVGSGFTGSLQNFRMDVQQVATTALSGTFQTGFSNSSIVYGPQTLSVPTSGYPAVVTIPLSRPIKWDGTNNLLIQTLYSNNNQSTNGGVQIEQSTTSFTSVSFDYGDDWSPSAWQYFSFAFSSSQRPNLTLGHVPVCASARQSVFVTYAPPLALSLSTNAVTICEGSTSSPVTVTSTLSNFNTYTWSPGGGIVTGGTPAGTSVTFNGTTSTTYTLSAVNTSTNCRRTATVQVTVNPKPLPPSVSAPDSVCQSSASATGLTANPATPVTSVSGSLVAGPTYVRSEDTNGSSTYTTPGAWGNQVYYHLYSFTVNTTGTYTFSGCGTPASFDIFGSLYAGSFDPAAPATNLLQADDDANGLNCNPWGAQMTQSLTAGVTYILVTSSYWSFETGTFVWQITGPGSVSQPASLRWYATATGGSVLSTASPFNPINVAGSGVTNTSAPGTYTFYAANFNGTCESDRVAVNFIIRPQSIAPTTHVSSVTSTCAGSPVTLTQTGGQLGQGATWRWYTDPACTPASLVGSSTAANASLVVNPTVPTTYYVRAEGGTTPCSPVNTPVTAVGVAITINPTGYWVGNNTNWNDVSNWCGGIPSTSTNIVIPDYGTGGVYPIIPAGYTASANNITLAGNARITINSTGRLNLLGALTNNGTIINRGEIAITGTGAQTFPGTGTGTIAYMNQLTVDKTSGTTTIDQPLTIAGTLLPNRGAVVVNQPITIRSTNDTTARVGIVGTGVTITYGTNGRFVVERYIPARRAWRLLTSPIIGATGQSINAAWQEGVTRWPMGAATIASNPNPGYGTHISGGTQANGYDQNVNGNASIRYFNSGWVNLPTSTSLHSLKVTDHRAFMVFVRGSRALNMAQGAFAIPDNTTLRSQGQINVANTTPVSVTSSGLTLVGNPFASAINFRQLATNNGFLNDAARNRFYLWDPTLAGTRNVGAFVTVAYNTVTGNYDRTIFTNGVNYTTAGGNQGIDNQGTIQSGLGFFMNFGASNTTVNFAENVKVAGSTPAVFRPGPQIRTSLKTVLASGETYINDGVLVNFHSAFSNDMDQNDVEKVNNFTENLSLMQGGQHLAIERRKPVQAGDTLHLRLRNLTINNFQFEFAMDSMANPMLAAFLGDRHLNTETPISLTDTTRYNFTIAANPASIWAEDRFYVVFKPSFGAPVPVRFVDIQAYQQQAHIAVEWKVSQEVNIDAYEVERSVDGRNFTLVQTVQATAPQVQVKTYAWLDENIQPGTYYYRVRSIGRAGDRDYTRVVRVVIGGKGSGFTVYPNPVRGTQIGLQVSNVPAGRFAARLYNASGQLMLDQVITHPGGNANYTVASPTYLAPGTYQLHLADPAENKTAATIQVLVQ